MVMSVLAAHPGANLICNGIKDAEYMELVRVYSGVERSVIGVEWSEVLDCVFGLCVLGCVAWIGLGAVCAVSTVLCLDAGLALRPASPLRLEKPHRHSKTTASRAPPPCPKHDQNHQVLHCRELGINALVVMEQYAELDTLLAVARRLGVRPGIGVRAKLTTQHRGHWGSTSGALATG